MRHEITVIMRLNLVTIIMRQNYSSDVHTPKIL